MAEYTVFLESTTFDMVLNGKDSQGGISPVVIDEEGRIPMRSLQVYHTAAGDEVVGLAEDEGTVRGQVILWDTAAGTPLRAAGEPVSAQAMVSLYGWNGAALTQVMMEATGEVRTAPVGVDEAGNLDNFRTDPNRIQWVRAYEEYVEVASAALGTAGSGLIWDPATTANELYEFEYYISNNEAAPGAARWYNIGLDQGGGGALALAEYWAYQEIVPWPGTTGWRGPFVMNGSDHVRGRSQALVSNTIHFRVKRVDTGA